MKKLLGISLVAMLAVSPLAANAVVGVTPIGTGSTPAAMTSQPADAAAAVTAGVAVDEGPYFDLAKEGANDSNLATGAYVKGAYNAAIKAVNTVHAEVDALNADLTSSETDLKDGIISTVNKATATVTATGSITGGTGAIATLTGWGSDTTGTANIDATTLGFSGTAATGTVAVDGYYATAATANPYTSVASGTAEPED